jgi:hypothetical protein
LLEGREIKSESTGSGSAPVAKSLETTLIVGDAVAAPALGTIYPLMDQNAKAPILSGTARLDATTEAAYAIIDKRLLDRETKTAKLRTLRLEKEAAERAARAAEGPKSKKTKKAEPVS